MNKNMNIIFMLLAVESNFLYYNYFIDLIDHYLTDYFIDYPILVELSLSDSRGRFIEIINNSEIDKSVVDFNNLLVGFIIISFEKISYLQFLIRKRYWMFLIHNVWILVLKMSVYFLKKMQPCI